MRVTILRDDATITISFSAGYLAGGDPTMRMFETVASSLLAIAAQALVVGVVVSTL